MTDDISPHAAPRRGRGRPPRVSRGSIIEAARGLSLEEFSMQAVADRLGVDRSTINYHFADRDELFAVVASVTLGSELQSWTPPESEDWRDWVVDYTRRVHDALVRHGSVSIYVRMPLGADVGSLAPVEGMISKLSEAGFDDRTVAHAVSYIAEVAHATAQDEILVANGPHPQGPELIRYLDAQSADVAPGLRRLVAVNPHAGTEYFEFALKVLIAGLESQLPSSR